KYVGLEFEDCDFHKEIVLTQKCSDYLKEKGFTYLIQLKNLMNNLQQPLTKNIRLMLSDVYLNNETNNNINENDLSYTFT
ncbi:TPA: hypothetical protein U6329_002522, partial [Legionella pneumophila]|nr:hypothetical protein [Legionella pneumophila]